MGKNGTTWDVTRDIKMRLGPQGDCHGMKDGIVTDWVEGAERLLIETLDSEFVIMPVENT
jgi:hypothetical protein